MLKKTKKIRNRFVYVLDIGQEPKAIFTSKVKAERYMKRNKVFDWYCVTLTKFPLNTLLRMDKDTMGELDHDHYVGEEAKI
jgi:hypothetical protein